MSIVSSLSEGHEPDSDSDSAPVEKARPNGAEPHPGRTLDKKNLSTRIGSSLVLSAVGLWGLCAGVVPFAILGALLVSVGILEFCALARRTGLRPSRGIAVAGGLVVLTGAAIAPMSCQEYVLAFTLVSTMICAFFRGGPTPTPERPRYLDSMTTVFAWLWVAWLLSFVILLRRFVGHLVGPWGIQVEAGIAYVLLFIITIAANDIGCFAIGKTLGRHSLAPHISPNKTIEGSVGGLVISTLVALLLGHGFGIPPLTAAAYGAAVGVAAQLGDLWESMVKREAGVKDSGRLIAGHGGVLDRFDSYVFAAPTAYIMCLLLLPR